LRRPAAVGQARYASRAGFQAGVVGRAIDQNEVAPDVAVAVIVQFAAGQVIEVAVRQRLVLRQHVDGFEQQGGRGACCAVPISPACGAQIRCSDPDR
jgi:hypothetical protein